MSPRGCDLICNSQVECRPASSGDGGVLLGFCTVEALEGDTRVWVSEAQDTGFVFRQHRRRPWTFRLHRMSLATTTGCACSFASSVRPESGTDDVGAGSGAFIPDARVVCADRLCLDSQHIKVP